MFLHAEKELCFLFLLLLFACLFIFFLVKEILRNSEGGVSVSTASLQRSEKNSKMMTFNGNV